MATALAISSDIAINGASNKCKLFTWALTATNLDGSAVSSPGAQKITVQLTGTIGASTVVLQGSNDGTNWDTLNNLAGTAISFTGSVGLKGVAEAPLFIRPLMSGTGGTITVALVMSA